jgi:hypothetical protein
MSPLLLTLALCVLALPPPCAGGSGLIHAAPAYYPRLLSLSGGGAGIGAVLEAPTPAQRRLLYLPRSPATGAWGAPALIAAAAMDAAGSVDLANGALLQLPNGTLLCAFRHHDGVGAARVFRLQVAASQDAGRSWAPLATITSGPTGVWEPFLFLTAAGALRVAYAAELTNGGEQDIVVRAGAGGGASWGPPLGALHSPLTRNGMPGVAALRDGSLLVVHEAFVGAACAVHSARSVDGGATWGQRQVVRAPALPARAGSPQVALCAGGGGSVCAVFMSSEAGVGGGGGGEWPDGARTVAVCAPLSGAGNGSAAAVDWGAGSERAVATATATSLWPSFLVGAGGSGSGVLGVAYQGSDGAAYLQEGFAC